MGNGKSLAMKGGNEAAFLLNNIIGSNFDDLHEAISGSGDLQAEYNNITGDDWPGNKAVLSSQISDWDEADDTETLNALLQLVTSKWQGPINVTQA